MSYAKAALQYTLDKIREAEVVHEPYPHIEIEGIFEPEYYKLMVKNWPNYTHMVNENENVLRTDLLHDPSGGGNWLTYKDLPDGQRSSFWEDFTENFLAGDIQDILFSKYSIKNQANFTVGRLIVDKKGSGLGPHTERFDKLCVFLFYTPFDEKPRPECSTLIFEPFDKDIAWSHEHHTFEEFKEVGQCVYRPNTFFSFKVCRQVGGPWSFHGYRQFSDYNRQTIKCFVQQDLDPAYVRKIVNESRHRSRRWREQEKV